MSNNFKNSLKILINKISILNADWAVRQTYYGHNNTTASIKTQKNNAALLQSQMTWLNSSNKSI